MSESLHQSASSNGSVEPLAKPTLRVRLRRWLAYDNPLYLLNLFTLLTVASAALIMGVVGTSMHWIYSGAMVRSAETSSINVGRAIFERERDNLLVVAADGSAELRVDAGQVARLDARMRSYLAPFGMQKLKVYDSGMKIVYSTDRLLIGRVDEDNDVLAEVLRSGQVYSERVQKKSFAELGGGNIADAAIVETYVPLSVAGRNIGAFELYVDITGTRKEVARLLVMSLTVLAAVLFATLFSLYRPMKRATLDLLSAHANLRELSTRDYLTGVYNRRFLSDHVTQEFQRRRRLSGADEVSLDIGFIMADIDHFKRINDGFGHAGGDQVLREVSLRMSAALRSYDVIGRYGGEEFLVMLPNTDEAAATAVALRLHAAVAQTPILIGGYEPVSVTVSVGVASAARDDASEETAIARADSALYRAKAEGRNRVCVHGRDEPGAAAAPPPPV